MNSCRILFYKFPERADMLFCIYSVFPLIQLNFIFKEVTYLTSDITLQSENRNHFLCCDPASLSVGKVPFPSWEAKNRNMLITEQTSEPTNTQNFFSKPRFLKDDLKFKSLLSHWIQDIRMYFTHSGGGKRGIPSSRPTGTHHETTRRETVSPPAHVPTVIASLLFTAHRWYSFPPRRRQPVPRPQPQKCNRTNSRLCDSLHLWRNTVCRFRYDSERK